MSVGNPFDWVDGAERMFHHLRPEIPLEEAANFFVGIKKFAEWTDPPDTAGELEGQFSVPVEQVLAKLKEVITSKYRKMVAYSVYGQCFRGQAWSAAKNSFRGHAYDEQDAGDYYVQRAVALGGPVHMDEIEPPPPSNNPLGILKVMARAEQEGIAVQRELRDMVGEDNPMKIGIEKYLLRDQQHLDETWQMMTQEEHALIERGTAEALPPEAPGEPPMEGEEALEEAAPVEEEAPEGPPEAELEELPLEEKAASMRLSKALQKYAAEKTVPTDEELKEVGRQRGVASLAAEAQREKGRRGERYGGLVGRLLGAAGGGVAGHKVGKGLGTSGHLASTTLGALGGSTLGRHLGREVGAEADIVKNAAAAMRFTLALEKLADDGAIAGEAQMAPPGVDQELQPSNYLQAEMQGQQAQNSNESAYYRQQLEQSQQAMQTMEQQTQMAQEQLQGLQQQAEQANMQVQQAAQSAQQAHDMATEQTMQAAKARIGAQQMRQQMLQLASQDPQALGEATMGPSPEEMALQQQEQGMEGAEGGMAPGEAPPDAAGGAPAAPEGPAGMAPEPQTAPGAATPEGQPDTNAPAKSPPKPKDQASATPVQVKVGAVNPRMLGAAVGGGLGAGMSVIQGARAPGLQQRVQELQGQQDGGFMQAARLAKAQAASAVADLSAGHPAVSALKGGLLGAGMGALAGPSLAQRAQHIRADLPDAARGVGRILGMR